MTDASWLDNARRTTLSPTCRWCGRDAQPAGRGPCQCAKAMEEHRRIMADDR